MAGKVLLRMEVPKHLVVSVDEEGQAQEVYSGQLVGITDQH